MTLLIISSSSISSYLRISSYAIETYRASSYSSCSLLSSSTSKKFFFINIFTYGGVDLGPVGGIYDSFRLLQSKLQVDLFLFFLKHHLQGFFVEFRVSPEHQFFEGDEVVNCCDLANHFLVDGVGLGFLAGFQELLLGYV